MTATNHTLTGAVLGLAAGSVLPWWAVLPLAVLTHYAMDALPHFGQRNNEAAALNRLKWLLPLDAAVALAVLLALFFARPPYWLLAVAAGVLCASPDLLRVGRFTRFLHRGEIVRANDWQARFHRYIQWGEWLWGAWVELAWFMALGYVLLTKL